MNINNNSLFGMWIEYLCTLISVSIEVLVRFVKFPFSEDDEETPLSFKQVFARKVFGRNYFGPTDATRCFGVIFDKAEKAKLWDIPFTFFQLIKFRNRRYRIVSFVAKDPARIIEFLNRSNNRPTDRLVLRVSFDFKEMEQARNMDPCGWYLVPPISDIISEAESDRCSSGDPWKSSQGIPSVVSEVGLQPMSAWLAAYMLLVDFVRVNHPTLGNQSFVTSTELVLPRRMRTSRGNAEIDPALRVRIGPFAREVHESQPVYVLKFSTVLLRNASNSSDDAVLVS